MKLIYQTLLVLLKDLTDIRFIDLDKGQLEIGRLAVAFPCILINIDIPETTDSTDRKQRVRARAILRVGFNYTGMTQSNTPKQNREDSLAFFDMVTAITGKLQGYYDKDIALISRVGVQNEVVEQNIKIVRLVFDIWYDEDFDL